MNFGSVCSGIEAASVAWHPLGWQAAWLAEIEPFPSAVLKHHYPEVPNLGDMTALPQRIRAGEVEAPDLFCGGTPCQAFSVAGLRQSLSDERGNLSLIFVEIANAIDSARSVRREAPCVVFWENVPGVLSTKDNAFGCFLGALAGCDTALVPRGRWTDAGVVAGPQRTVAWRTLDAQYFGLAQRRRRVFVVASARNDFDPAAVLFEREGVRRDSAPSREAGKGVARGAATSAGSGVDFQNVTDTGDLCGTLMGEAQKKAGQAGHGVLAFGGGQNCTQTDVSTALSAHPGGSRLDFQTETFITQTYAKTHKPASTTDAEGWSPVEASPTITHWFRDRSDTGTDVAVVQSIGVTLHGTDGTQSVASFTDLSSSLRARIPSGVENSTTTAVLQPVHRDVAQPYTLAIRGRGDTHQLEYRQDGTANALLTPNGGRGGIGVGAIAHIVRGEGFDASEDGTGRGTPLVPVAYSIMPMNSGKDYKARETDVAQPLMAGGPVGGNQGGDFIAQPVGVFQDSEFGVQQYDSAGTLRAGRIPEHQMVLQPVHAFDARQSDVVQYGDMTGPLDTDGHSVGVLAFSSKDHGGDATADLAPTLRAMNHADSHANGGGQMAVAFQPGNLSRGAGSPPSGEVFPTLKSDHGRGLSDQQPHVMQAMQVRRLTPVECERLQGFPDGYTAIPWRNKPASECPDGPRYKALGNSWAVPVVRWIGARIQRNLT